MKSLFQLALLFLPFGLMAQAHIEQYNKGVTAQNSGDYYVAMIAYNKAISLDKNYAPAYAGRAAVYLHNNQHENAIADATKAIKLDANNLSAYQTRGLTYKAKEDYKSAVADFGKEIELTKDSKRKAMAYYNRGFVYQELMNNESQLADFKKAVELQPENADYQYHCGRAKFDTGGDEYKSAIDNFTKVIELQPENKDGYTERATYYMTFQQFDKALVDLKKAKELGADVNHLIDAAKFEAEMQKGN